MTQSPLGDVPGRLHDWLAVPWFKLGDTPVSPERMVGPSAALRPWVYLYRHMN